MLRWLAVFAVLALFIAPGFAQEIDAATRAAQEKAARQKLDAVRAELRAVAEAQRHTRDARGDAFAALRTQELAVAAMAREVQELDARMHDEAARLAELDTRRQALHTELAAQRESLGELLRSAYAIGQHAQLRQILQLDDFSRISRVLAYHRYFQRAQVKRIEALLASMRELAVLEQAIQSTTAELARVRAERSAEAEKLAAGRAERERLVAELDARLGDQAARMAALGKDEAALTSLLEKLRDIFADIPPQLTRAESVAAARGRLEWPLRGRILTTYGSSDDSGRKSSGILIAAAPGSQVHAISHGRVAFADWLRGYGLMLILDHGDGYLSLYGGNETLLKDVGDWVDAGEVVATSGASGGQKHAGLYFELRVKGKPADPRGWLKK